MANGGDEMQWGYIPSRDGSDYDPSSPTPRLRPIYKALVEAGINDFVLIAIGDLGSPGAKHGVSGMSTVTDVQSLFNADWQGGNQNLQQRWSRLFNAVTPFKHVSAIVIRPLY